MKRSASCFFIFLFLVPQLAVSQTSNISGKWTGISYVINPMGIVCDSKKLIFLIKPTPTPSKEGNLILQTSKFIIYKTRRVNSKKQFPLKMEIKQDGAVLTGTVYNHSLNNTIIGHYEFNGVKEGNKVTIKGTKFIEKRD
jgi:hypothetical protein